MQKALLVLNGLLLIAVVYLLADKFAGGGSSAPEQASSEREVSDQAGVTIAYVNVDTLLNNFDLFRERQKGLTAKEQEEDARLRTRGKALEREIMALQEKAAGGTMTPRDLQAEEERLMRKQQEFMADQENISRKLMEESVRINNELQGMIVTAIRDFKGSSNYDYVISYGEGSPVLAVNEEHDITRIILNKLNQQVAK
jgi:outer membrane protein